MRWFLNVSETCLFASVGYTTLIGLHPINLRDCHSCFKAGCAAFPKHGAAPQTEHRMFIWGFGGTSGVTDTFILLGWVVSRRNIHAGLDHIITWLLLLFESASIPKTISGTEYFTVNWAFMRENDPNWHVCELFHLHKPFHEGVLWRCWRRRVDDRGAHLRQLAV